MPGDGLVTIKATGLTRAQWDALKNQIDVFLGNNPQLSLVQRQYVELG